MRPQFLRRTSFLFICLFVFFCGPEQGKPLAEMSWKARGRPKSRRDTHKYVKDEQRPFFKTEEDRLTWRRCWRPVGGRRTPVAGRRRRDAAVLRRHHQHQHQTRNEPPLSHTGRVLERKSANSLAGSRRNDQKKPPTKCRRREGQWRGGDLGDRPFIRRPRPVASGHWRRFKIQKKTKTKQKKVETRSKVTYPGSDRCFRRGWPTWPRPPEIRWRNGCIDFFSSLHFDRLHWFRHVSPFLLLSTWIGCVDFCRVSPCFLSRHFFRSLLTAPRTIFGWFFFVFVFGKEGGFMECPVRTERATFRRESASDAQWPPVCQPTSLYLCMYRYISIYNTSTYLLRGRRGKACSTLEAGKPTKRTTTTAKKKTGNDPTRWCATTGIPRRSRIDLFDGGTLDFSRCVGP